MYVHAIPFHWKLSMEIVYIVGFMDVIWFVCVFCTVIIGDTQKMKAKFGRADEEGGGDM